MSADLRLLQRYQDGEATRAEAVGAERLLATSSEVQAQAKRREALDQMLLQHAQDIRHANRSPSGLVQAAMQLLPQRPPKRQVRLSVGHLLVGCVALGAIIMGSALPEHLRESLLTNLVALVCGIAGIALVLAARPLVQLEASVFSRLMRRRLAVGDGDVLVCRVLGLALLIGGSHVVGLWG